MISTGHKIFVKFEITYKEEGTVRWVDYPVIGFDIDDTHIITQDGRTTVRNMLATVKDIKLFSYHWEKPNVSDNQ